MSVLVGGGAKVAASALGAHAVDKILFFYAPIILGGDGRIDDSGSGISGGSFGVDE